MIRVFISHQRADSLLATQIAGHLRLNHQIDSYLDVIDPGATRGEDLADHIRNKMSGCTQLIAVVSPATSSSQWVPWEIGVATEKDFPLATFSNTTALPPEFLRKWPYMRTFAELDQYALASKFASASYSQRRRTFTESIQASTKASTHQFYANLRSRLGQ